ncbi:MAG: hypothetical protein IKU19_03835, partial [Clostridia bacterium]|nr:hypothetical protein [Clostridia bacterium]
MFKKSLIILIAAAMLISAVACSKNTTADNTDVTTTDPAVTTSNEPRFKIPEDVEFTDSQMAAAESAQEHLEVGVSRPKLINALVEE